MFQKSLDQVLGDLPSGSKKLQTMDVPDSLNSAKTLKRVSRRSSNPSRSVNILEPKHQDVDKRKTIKRRAAKRQLDGPPEISLARRLRASQLKSRTQTLCAKTAAEFDQWCREHGTRKKDHTGLGKNMTCFIHELCEDGRCFTDASYAVFGWIALRSDFHVAEKDQLPFAKQALKGWKSRFPPKSRAGIDLQLWDLVALQYVHTYLRPCELIALKKASVLQPQAVRRHEVWGLIIVPFEDGKPTKAGEYDDVVLFNTHQRFDTNVVIKSLFSANRGHEKLFPHLTYRKYCDQIAQAAEKVGLSAPQLTPRILRHSGASHDAYHGVRDAQQIQVRGRWKASRSVLRYKKPGRMLLQHSKVTRATWTKSRSARSQVIPLLTAAFASGQVL